MRVASIDIGTNSVLLLIVEHTASDPAPRTLVDRCTITRLGRGVDKDRRLDPAAVERTLTCLRDYATVAKHNAVDQVAAVATSAVRDASGSAEFVDAAERVLGTRPRVIDGLAEAELTFVGAVSGLSLAGPVQVFDIGGGSTEIVYGQVGGVAGAVHESAVSLDVGAVRLTERHLHADPPSAAEVAAIHSEVRAALRDVARPSSEAPWVGIAGTITTLCAMELGMEPYDGRRVHGQFVTAVRIADWVEKLASMPLVQRRSIRGLDPARADVILAGAVILQEILAWAGASGATVSDRGVRWGLAESLLGSRTRIESP